ncbi:MAG TPA: ABC transporter ATP-binding protein [Bacteroidia bacterium]|nr:ABC transporter ATP-binding protein [Bacteroidia bacterium]
MENKTHNTIRFPLIARILSYTKPYRAVFWWALVVTITLSSLAIVRPLLISKALNEVVLDTKNSDRLNTICWLILSFLVLEAGLQVVNARLGSVLGQNIVRDMRQQVYRHILSLKNSYFDGTPVGTLVTRAISDIESLSDVFTEGFIVIAGDLLMLIIFIAVMIYMNWILALLALSTIPLLFVATALFKKGIKTTFTQVRNAVAALNTFTQEHLSAMRIVQLFNREEKEMEKFRQINAQHRDANIRSIFYYSVFFPVVEILSSVSIALVIWFAGIKGRYYAISLGDVTFFVMMVNMMFRPIRMLADRLNTLQMGFVSAERVFKVLDTREQIVNSGKTDFIGVKECIEFKSLWFAYRDEQYVLKDISFRISAGETIALVGATGAGKSSIVNLLNRFYDYNKGSISIDGLEIGNYRLESLRSKIAVVLQDVQLFNDTILNNITLNDPSITHSEVLEATTDMGLMEYIESLPGGFDFQVRERGLSLSAGQRQLVAFIRAYVHRPVVFVLDEATATIDTPTELLIQKAIEKIAKGRTSIIIAHRLSTIRHVNKILVLEEGRVVEEGSLNQLLELGGRFKQLYDLQFALEENQ